MNSLNPIIEANNTDQNPRLALDYAIRSIPAVKLFRQGQIIEEFLGAQPERVIRATLERHLERASDRLRLSQHGPTARRSAKRRTAIESSAGTGP